MELEQARTGHRRGLTKYNRGPRRMNTPMQHFTTDQSKD